MQTITRKVGNTFLISASVGFDLTDWEVRSQIRSMNGTLLAELEYTPLNIEDGTFTLIFQETSTWKPGQYQCDIEYTNPNGIIISTATLNVELVRGITV